MHASMVAAKHAVRAVKPSTAKEPLQVRIPVDIKRNFKAQAALRGLDPNELFVEVWKHWLATKQSGGGF